MWKKTVKKIKVNLRYSFCFFFIITSNFNKLQYQFKNLKILCKIRMENPDNKEVIDALNTVFLSGYNLTEEENEFILDCINSPNAIEFLRTNLETKNVVAISIYNKLENLYNEMDENRSSN